MTVRVDEIHRIKRGLTLPLEGAPGNNIEDGPPVRRVALSASDYIGMRPRMRVHVGDTVKRGEVLFEDRRAPGIFYTAPGAGTVTGVNRGDRRVLLSVVIDLDEGDAPPEVSYRAFKDGNIDTLEPAAVRALMLESGLWTAFRSRPFDKVPAPNAEPKAIFVTAADPHPLAPDPTAVLAGRGDHWKAGLAVLAKLVPEGRLVVCVGPGFELETPDTNGIEVHAFEGRYPAGTPGLAMHTLFPVNRERTAWHIGYQDVAAVGHLFQTGKLDVERVVALTGPGIEAPNLVRTRLGAPVDDLVATRRKPGSQRAISGSALNGREASGDVTGYLGRYHQQVTVLNEADERRFLGWLAPGLDVFSVLRLFASRLLPVSKPHFSTDHHGGERAMVPLGVFEKIWPFELLPTPLLRALLADDIETAEALGCLELAEEDVALLSFVCPSKIDYGRALRNMLDRIEEEG